MKKVYKHILSLLLIIFSLIGCQSIKDGLTGQKKNNSDEFLVKKKNPLVLPPKFGELPKPKTLTKQEKFIEEEIDLKVILTNQKNIKNPTSANNSLNKSLEKNILEKIKKN